MWFCQIDNWVLTKTGKIPKQLKIQFFWFFMVFLLTIIFAIFFSFNYNSLLNVVSVINVKSGISEVWVDCRCRTQDVTGICRIIFSTVCFQMSPKIACKIRCIVTLFAFVRLFSTVCFQMSPQMACPRRSIVALIAFVRFFSTVYFHMRS